MFHPGDIVSYGTNGVCEITEQKRVRPGIGDAGDLAYGEKI